MTERPDVLVIGASGLVGSHVVRAFGRRALGTFRRGVEVVVDVTDPDSVRQAIETVEPKVVVIAAAEPYVERCERNPTGTRLVNVGGTQHVRLAAPTALLVVFSSEYVFDGTAGPYSEDAPTAPLNEYGRQKVEIEAIARSGPHLVLRTSGVFGHEAGRKNFVLQLVDNARAGRSFRVASDQAITPSYAPSLAAAIVELVDRSVTGTLHVCGPRVLPRVEFARMVARAYRLPLDLIEAQPTSRLGLAAARPLSAGLSDARLRRTLGHGLAEPEAALREMAGEAR